MVQAMYTGPRVKRQFALHSNLNARLVSSQQISIQGAKKYVLISLTSCTSQTKLASAPFNLKEY